MATWAGGYVKIGGATGCRARIETQFAGNNVGGNYSAVNWQLYADFVNSDAQLDDGVLNAAGGQRYRNGGRIYNYSGNFNSKTIHISSGSFTVGHDANGYGSYGADANFSVFQSGRAYASGSTGLPRIALAPEGIAKSVDTITNVGAVLGRKHDNNGRGTSSANRVYYRQGNSGGWTWYTADQGGTGWKYNTVTGLTPNTTYSYFSRHWNNNGDTADTGASTFKTLASGGVTGVTNVKYNKATIAVGMNASDTGEANATVNIQYRKTGDTAWSDTSTSTSLTPSFALTGLKPNTNYQYRIAATNSTGTWEGDIATLKTGNPPGFVFILEDY